MERLDEQLRPPRNILSGNFTQSASASPTRRRHAVLDEDLAAPL